jgi:hypothetical protein
MDTYTRLAVVGSHFAFPEDAVIITKNFVALGKVLA